MKNTKSVISGIRIIFPCVLTVTMFLVMTFANFSLKANEYLPGRRSFQPEKPVILYIVDREEWSAEEVDELNLDDIEQMEYITEKDKIKLYTDEEVDRVVIISLKKEVKEQEQKEQIE